MNDWTSTTWGAICTLNYGKALKGYKDETDGVPVYGTNGHIGYTNRALQNEAGVIIGRKGAYRGVHYSSEPFFVIDTAFALKTSDGVDARWAYYSLSNVDINSMDSGSAIPSTNRDEFYAIPVALPAMFEQKQIAATLGTLDDKIELNRQMNATLEEMARALYRSWFVDFDPVHAKAEGRVPAHMDAETAALFPDSFGEDGLPEGWEERQIGEELIVLDAKRVPLSKHQRLERSGSYPYHGATSIMDYVDDYLFDEVLLLVGEDGSVVREDGTPFTQYVWGKLWVNNHAHVLKGRKFSVEQLKCIFDQTAISAFVTGAVQLKLNQANMKRIPFMFANAAIHSAFDKLIARWFAQIRQLNEQSLTLANLRDALLPKLMSGEIRVREAEEMIEEVA